METCCGFAFSGLSRSSRTGSRCSSAAGSASPSWSCFSSTRTSPLRASSSSTSSGVTSRPRRPPRSSRTTCRSCGSSSAPACCARADGATSSRSSPRNSTPRASSASSTREGRHSNDATPGPRPRRYARRSRSGAARARRFPLRAVRPGGRSHDSRSVRLAAIEDRIEADLALGRHADLVGELEALVGQHPLRERPRALLMLALYRSGRQADALDVYRRTRDYLIDELGIEPGPALQRLEKAVLVAGRIARAAPADTGSSPRRPCRGPNRHARRARRRPFCSRASRHRPAPRSRGIAPAASARGRLARGGRAARRHGRGGRRWRSHGRLRPVPACTRTTRCAPCGRRARSARRCRR